MKSSYASGLARHFLDLLDTPADELRAILDASKAMKIKPFSPGDVSQILRLRRSCDNRPGCTASPSDHFFTVPA